MYTYIKLILCKLSCISVIIDANFHSNHIITQYFPLQNSTHDQHNCNTRYLFLYTLPTTA